MVKCLRTLQHQGPTEEILVVKQLPFYLPIFLQYSFPLSSGYRATKVYVSIGCSEWRPHFPTSLTARCVSLMNFWLTGSKWKRCVQVCVLRLAIFLLSACWIVDVRDGFRAAQTLPISLIFKNLCSGFLTLPK